MRRFHFGGVFLVCRSSSLRSQKWSTTLPIIESRTIPPRINQKIKRVTSQLSGLNLLHVSHHLIHGMFSGMSKLTPANPMMIIGRFMRKVKPHIMAGM